VDITEDLKWSLHTNTVVKKVQQCLFNLMKLKKFVLSPKTLNNVYRCTIESTVRLYHCLVWQLHHPQLQGSPESGADSPTLH
jgi:hypothetical protein